MFAFMLVGAVTYAWLIRTDSATQRRARGQDQLFRHFARSPKGSRNSSCTLLRAAFVSEDIASPRRCASNQRPAELRFMIAQIGTSSLFLSVGRLDSFSPARVENLSRRR